LAEFLILLMSQKISQLCGVIYRLFFPATFLLGYSNGVKTKTPEAQTKMV